MNLGTLSASLVLRDQSAPGVNSFLKNMGSVNQATSTLSKIGSTALGTFTGFVSATAVLGGVSAAMSAAKTAAIGMNASLETSELQFATLMGDAQKAKAHVAGLFEFAKKTPFETGPIIEASKKLQTFGGSALNTMGTLTLLGDASAATGAPINDLGFWVGRLYSNLKGGQPFGEAAMRLQELAVLSPETRKQMEALQKSGAGATQVFNVFERDLGKFGGAMIAQASTWDGATSTFMDSAQMMLAKGLRPLFEGARDGLNALNNAMNDPGFGAALGLIRDGFKEAFGFSTQGLVLTLLSKTIDFGTYGIEVFRAVYKFVNALRLPIEAVGTAVLAVIEKTVSAAAYILELGASIPGVGRAFQGSASMARSFATVLGETRKEFQANTAEAWKAVTGQSAMDKVLDGVSQGLQVVKSHLVTAQMSTNANTAATVKAGAAYNALGESGTGAMNGIARQTDKVTAKIRQMSRELASMVERGFDRDLLGQLGIEIAKPEPKKMAFGDLFNPIAAKTSSNQSEWNAWLGRNMKAGVPAFGTAAGISTPNVGWATKLFGAESSGAFGASLANTALGALTGGGSLGKSLGGMIGGSAMGKLASGSIGKLLGGAVGSVIPGLGTIVGSFAGAGIQKLIGGLFGGGKEKKETKAMLDDFIGKSGGLESVKKLADEVDFSLTKMLSAKNKKDLQTEIDALGKAVDASKTKLEGAQMALDGVNLRASALAVPLAGQLTKVNELSSALAAMKENGSPEDIAKTTAALEAERGVMSAMAADSQGSFERLGVFVQTALVDVSKKTGSLHEALSALAPSFDVLKAGVSDFGMTSTATIDHLLGLQDLVTGKYKDQFDALDANRKMTLGWMQSGVMNRDLWQTIGTDIGAQLDKLKLGGADMNKVYATQQPLLQALWEGQQKYGVVTDESTAAALRQAEQMGIVGANQKGVMDKVLDVLLAIGDALGAKIPNALRDFKTITDSEGGHVIAKGLQIEETWRNVADRGIRNPMRGAFLEMGASAETAVGRVNDSLGRIRVPDVNVPIKFSSEGGKLAVGGTEIDLPEFETGSRGLIDFGAGRLAALHGEEEVLTRSQGAGVAEMVQRALATARGRGDQPIQLNVYVDKNGEVQVLTEAHRRQIQGWHHAKRITIPGDSVIGRTP